jgi:hypothetical protein
LHHFEKPAEIVFYIPALQLGECILSFFNAWNASGLDFFYIEGDLHIDSTGRNPRAGGGWA